MLYSSPTSPELANKLASYVNEKIEIDHADLAKELILFFKFGVFPNDRSIEVMFELLHALESAEQSGYLGNYHLDACSKLSKHFANRINKMRGY